MRSPYPISIYTKRPLTDLQSLRRGRVLERSRPYRDYRKRLHRSAKRRGDQGKSFPIRGGLLWQWAYKMQGSGSAAIDTLGQLDLPAGIPHEQLMLEVETLRKSG